MQVSEDLVCVDVLQQVIALENVYHRFEDLHSRIKTQIGENKDLELQEFSNCISEDTWSFVPNPFKYLWCSKPYEYNSTKAG